MAANPPTLPGLEAPPKLTERQEIALGILRENGPMGARELGRMYREKVAWGKHPAFDETNGLQLAKELRRKGLAKRRYRNSTRGPSGWYAIDADGTPWRKPADPAADCCNEFPFCRCAA